ncbi:MAG: DUF58 domain-containing protein [Crocinitomicaceae bacterium]|nr:DUF58 domain-containing protein [Crocinitomicaceae bacterium]
METSELIKKVKKIEIKSKGLSSQIFSGEYHSAFKGRGMAFSEVRDYAVGDDIRTIDWNVTARLNETHVKVFEEERELTVMLLVDVSASEMFGTNDQLKRELITELCAVLAFSAVSNNDRIGLLMFSDQIEKFIPPKKGKTHILRIIRELISLKPKGTKTNISEALSYFTKMVNKRSIAFVLSDFQDENIEKAVKIASRKHDLIAIKTKDAAEENLPNLGLVKWRNLESGETTWVNTSSKKWRHRYKEVAKAHDEKIAEIFKRSKVDSVELYTNEDYIKPLKNLFKRRG